jgi:hypothetical protein
MVGRSSTFQTDQSAEPTRVADPSCPADPSDPSRPTPTGLPGEGEPGDPDRANATQALRIAVDKAKASSPFPAKG